MKIKWHLDVGYANCDREGEVEVADTATDAEIEEVVREEVFNFISWGWEKEEK